MLTLWARVQIVWEVDKMRNRPWYSEPVTIGVELDASMRSAEVHIQRLIPYKSLGVGPADVTETRVKDWLIEHPIDWSTATITWVTAESLVADVRRAIETAAEKF